MDIFESIADRKIRAAREAGLFDGLPGAGKPIPDLHEERPPGWWATRLVRRERSILKVEELDRDVRAAMPRLWRLDSESNVRVQVRGLNEQIEDYNRVTTWEQRQPLDEEDIVEQWKQQRRSTGHVRTRRRW